MILGGRNCDPRRNPQTINTRKCSLLVVLSKGLLLVVSLFDVVLTNKTKLDEGGLGSYRTGREPVADGERLG